MLQQKQLNNVSQAHFIETETSNGEESPLKYQDKSGDGSETDITMTFCFHLSWGRLLLNSVNNESQETQKPQYLKTYLFYTY